MKIEINKLMKKTIIISLVVIIIAIIAGGIWYFVVNKPKACTQEAKLCPDGTYVGRTGPNCEFTECPLAPGCNNLWWYDNEHLTCQQPKQFCAAYMYFGLQTFETKDECENSLVTKDWETYTNEKYGFEIKYPPNFNQLSKGQDAFGEYDSEKNLKGYIELTVITLDKNDSCDAENYTLKFAQGEFVTRREIKLSDENVKAWGVDKMPAPGSSPTQVYISRKNCAELGSREIIVFNDGCGPLHPESCSEIITNQILSTFKFIP